jgi:hypothetical protein
MFLMQIVILYFPSLLRNVIFCGICLLLHLSFIVSGRMVVGGEGAYLMRRHYIFISLYIPEEFNFFTVFCANTFICFRYQTGWTYFPDLSSSDIGLCTSYLNVSL